MNLRTNRKTMKKAILLILTLVFLQACGDATLNTSKEEKIDAVITGFDDTKCGCCWGYIIQIKDNRFLADNLPLDVDFNKDSIQFPMNVKIRFVMLSSSCYNRIQLVKVEKR